MFCKVHSVSGMKGDLFGKQSGIKLEEGQLETGGERMHKERREETIIAVRNVPITPS